MPVSRFHELLWKYPARANNWALLDRMRPVPKHVFTDDVIGFVQENYATFLDAFKVAAAAGQLDLPYNPMLVEFTKDDGIAFWLLSSEGGGHFRAEAAWINTDFEVINGRTPLPANTLHAYFPLRITAAGGMQIGEMVEDKGQKQFMEDSLYRQEAGMALFMAMTLHVRGIITRQPEPRDPKLERARAKRGQPAFTKDYVTVHIGYAVDRRGREIAFQEGTGRHMAVHMRAGHYRNQPYGPRFQDRKRIYIQPTMVNYRPDVAPPEPPQYLVVP